MAIGGRVLVRATVDDGGGIEKDRVERSVSIADVVGIAGRRETLSLVNGDNTLTVPTGTVLLVMLPQDDVRTVKLKGAAADAGVKIITGGGATTAANMLPVSLPLGTSATVVLNADGATTIDALWL